MTCDFEKNIRELLGLTSKNNVKLIAVTKTVPVEVINDAISLGITAIGENRVQELLEKYDKLNKENLEIHLIGTLQSNKVKYIIDKVDLIHSVDSIKLAQMINKCALMHGKTQDILVQINISGEQSKSGIVPDETESFIRQIASLSNIRVRGLMCIPSPETYMGENKVYFDAMQKIFVDIANKKLDNVYMDILSMGMSSDYETAIECGATAIRVGTKIFGKRKYTEV